MIRFDSDYIEGAHPAILQALADTNFEQHIGYGCDDYCERARDIIREHCGDHGLGVQFLVGGTQANVTVIDAFLHSYQGVISAESGHINVHESGAIEATGHKVLVLPQHDGKLKAEEVEKFIDDFYADETYEHMVAPGMVYISNPTEYGTIYTLEELADLSTVCEQAGIPLYMDGARLAYALAAEGNDVTLNDVARLCDVFYIGGTKVGALFGEAVVASPGWLHHFTPLVKQHGALLAKGRLLGVQFDALFTDGLYEKIGRHAVSQVIRIRDAFTAAGYPPFIPSPTNQQFFRLPNEVIDSLSDAFTFEYWGPRGETVSDIRIVTSWATRPSDVDAFISRIQSL